MVHTGIVLPTTFEGTENIVEITVLLCFENNALLITPKELFNLSKVHKRKSVIQAVNTTFIEKVKRIITNKYGKPKSEEVPLFTSFPAFQDGKIEQFSSDPSQKLRNILGKLIIMM
jgi:hypothetical protein